MLPFLAILSALGEGKNAYSQSVATRQQGGFAANIAEYNARFSDKAAMDAIDRGNIQANYAQGRVNALTGSQRAALAAQGLDPNSGVGLALQSDAQLMGANDIATIKANAYQEAWGYKTQALNERTQGRLTKNAAKFKAKNLLLEGALKVLGGAAGQFDSSSEKLTVPKAKSLTSGVDYPDYAVA